MDGCKLFGLGQVVLISVNYLDRCEILKSEHLYISLTYFVIVCYKNYKANRLDEYYIQIRLLASDGRSTDIVPHEAARAM